jgi:type I restriction enzyme S subunit
VLGGGFAIKYSAYPAYKDSGVEWLGEIPEDWEVKRLKLVCTFLDSHRIPLSSEERAIMVKEYPYYGASGIIDYVESYLFDEPLILVAEDGANLFSRSTPLAFVASGKYWVNNHAHILRPNDNSLAYWAYVLATIVYDPWITGSAQPKLTKDNLGSIRLPSPQQDERDAIASFLDRETAKIDALIAKKERLIELLQEKRTAIISHAVTQGLDPDVHMIRTRSKFFPELPIHWSISKPKYICTKIVDGTHHTPDYVEEGVPFITVKNLTAGAGISFDDCKYISISNHQEFCRRAQPEKGDVLITKDGTLGITRIIETNKEFSIFVSVALLKPIKSKVDSYYLRYAFECSAISEQFEANKLGSALKHLHLVEISNIDITVPPIEEQRSIVAYITNQITALEQLIDKVKQGLKYLEEYRTTLISAAVTGKISEQLSVISYQLSGV